MHFPDKPAQTGKGVPMNDKKKKRHDKSSTATGLGKPVGLFVENLVDVFTQAAKYTVQTTSAMAAGTLKTPEKLELMGKAGSALKDLRQTAGLTLDELSSAVDLENSGLLKSIEEGKAALPIDLMLRLASLYSRHDPLPFIIRFSHTYYPRLEKLLKTSGISNLLIEAERELKFINIYRSADDARQLSDEGFNRVLDFTRQAFLMALHFAADQENLDTNKNKNPDKNHGKNEDEK